MNRWGWLCAVVMSFLSAFAQQPVAPNLAAGEGAAVPALVNFSGALTDLNGKPITSLTSVTFLLYKDELGGAPLWIETQNVQPNRTGHYSVTLGATKAEGLSSDVFVSGEARWLAVQPEGQAEHPRVLLVAVPYAMKAADAETIRGLPPSAFVLATPPANGAATATSTATAGASANTAPPPASSVTTSGGTANTFPIFTTATNIQNGILTQTGAKAVNVLGLFNLPAKGQATATVGQNSQAFDFVASSFNSGTAAAVAQTFQLQAEPTGNNTTAPSGTLNVLFGSGTTVPAETGLKISNKGLVTFATGQKFPGAGTVTSVASGTGLTGGPITTTGTLSIDKTVVPQLNAANTFTATETMTANTSADVLNVTQSGGTGSGIAASTNSATGYGVVANATATTGAAVGVSGTTAAPIGNGVQGIATSTAGGVNGANGVYGLSSSPVGYGVEGFSNTNVGVFGTTAGTSFTSYGVEGAATTVGSAGTGVYGIGTTFGVQGNAIGAGSWGGSFQGGPSSNGIQGGPGISAVGGNDTTTTTGNVAGDGGVFGGGNSTNGSGGNGVVGIAGIPNAVGVLGVSQGQGAGVVGGDQVFSNTGSAYIGSDIGVWGDVGESGALAGVVATADDHTALIAQNNAANIPSITAYNASTSTTVPILLGYSAGLNGLAVMGGAGCGANYMGVQLGLTGMSSCGNYTFLGDASGNTYVNASGTTGTITFRVNNNGVTGLSGAMVVNHDLSVSIGTLNVTKTLTKPSGSFKIDHPLDPANKYLYHSFVESPDMKNIYDGTVTTDDNGLATVTLPDWFDALNSDFRYQLTVIGQFAQAIVASEISDNRFSIRTDKPNVKVSWQVTGIRQDAFANAHRIQVEVEKAPADRGRYLYPELFNAPETARIGYQATGPVAAPERKEVNPPVQAARVPVLHRRMMPPRPPAPKPAAPVVVAKPKGSQALK